MKTIRFDTILITACLWVLWGCSAAAPPQVVKSAPVEAKADHTPVETLAVEGIHGTISRSDVETVFTDRMGELHTCYAAAVEVFEDVEGMIEFFFTVSPSGEVSEGYISGSTLGSLEAEKCMLGKLLRFRFPKPEGGAADVRYDLYLEAPYEAPEPLAWTNADAQELLDEKKVVVEECLGDNAGVVVTVWVGPGGRVYATGASAETPEAYSSATCLAQQARTWIFPDPGREIAKTRLAF